jgi:hypothetical protein
MRVRLRVPRPTQDIRTIEPKPLPAGSTSARGSFSEKRGAA